MALLMTTTSMDQKSQTTGGTSPDERHRDRHFGGQNRVSGIIVHLHIPFQSPLL
jgi:hypothetical protein